VSGTVTATRRLALEAMRRIRHGEFADRVVRELFQPLDARDRAWAVELLYGTLRLRGRLDHLLNARVKGALHELEPDVLDVLRLGAFQLLEMGSVPPYAALSQSQELARAIGAGRASRLIAGVLHALRRSPEVEFPDRDEEPVGYLTTWGSHPEWLAERWVGRWGVAGAESLIEANNRRPELYIRPIGLGPEQAIERLREAGVEAAPIRISGRSVRIDSPASVPDVLAVVPAVVQDPAASLVVDYAAVPDGALVIDLCAAPGGKAVAASDPARFVVAADLSWSRIDFVRENVRRLGRGDRIAPVVADGRAAPFRPGGADVVVLDAPCTGTGTFRRHPDARWRVRPEHIESLGTLQRELIEAAAHLVVPGGVLVYATCSIEPEENDLQIELFLCRHPGWRIDPEPGAVAPELVSEEGALRVLPQREGFDGSYAVRLRRPG
jgi:16S rRNA (cytosine967-C5)-methyltransferase